MYTSLIPPLRSIVLELWQHFLECDRPPTPFDRTNVNPNRLETCVYRKNTSHFSSTLLTFRFCLGKFHLVHPVLLISSMPLFLVISGYTPQILFSQDSFVLFGYFHVLLITTKRDGPLNQWSHDLCGYFQGMFWFHQVLIQ